MREHWEAPLAGNLRFENVLLNCDRLFFFFPCLKLFVFSSSNLAKNQGSWKNFPMIKKKFFLN